MQESMDKVIQHCIRKEIIQNDLFDQKLEMKNKSPKVVFSYSVFTFTLVYYSMHRQQTLTLKGLSVFKRHMENVLSNMPGFLVSLAVVRKLDLMIIILRKKKSVRLSRSQFLSSQICQ